MTSFQPKKKLLGMRVTSVWDDTLHHGTFNNQNVVESSMSKHNGAAIVTVDELRWF